MSVTVEICHSAIPETNWAFAEVIGINWGGKGVPGRTNRNGVEVFVFVGVKVDVNVLVGVGVDDGEGVIVRVGDLLIVGERYAAVGFICSRFIPQAVQSITRIINMDKRHPEMLSRLNPSFRKIDITHNFSTS